MYIVNIQNGKNIKKLLLQIPANTVVTSRRLTSMGISRMLVAEYVKSGWLRRLAPGAYTRLNEGADITGALFALQADLMPTIHVGAATALNQYYGKLHFVKSETKTQLFAPLGQKVPTWFAKVYGKNCDINYSDFLPAETGLETRSGENFKLQVPSMERALLELLYLVPKKITISEAFAITETIASVKVALLQELLEKCSSIKVKRLLLCFAETAGLQWSNVLDISNVDLGSGVRKIGKDGVLYPKYNLVIPKLG